MAAKVRLCGLIWCVCVDAMVDAHFKDHVRSMHVRRGVPSVLAGRVAMGLVVDNERAACTPCQQR